MFAAGRPLPYSGGSSSGPRKRTSCSSVDAEALVHAPPRLDHQRDRVRARRAAGVLDEVRVPLRDDRARRSRWPFRPAALDQRARRPGPSSGFLKTLPNVRFFVGCVAFRCASSSATSALIASGGSGRQPEAHAGDDLAGHEPRVAVGEVELVGSPSVRVPPGRRRPRRRGPRSSRCRRRRRSSARRRRRCPGSPRRTRSPPSPAVAGAVQADGVRRARRRRRAARPRSRTAASSPAEPDDQPVEARRRATSRFEPSPTASTATPRVGRPARAPPSSSSSVSGRASQRAGPPVPIVVKRESATAPRARSRPPLLSEPARGSARAQRRRSPAPSTSSTSPGSARRARYSSRILDATASTRRAGPRSESASTTSLPVTAAIGLLAGEVDVGDDDVVGRGERRGELACEVARPRDEVRLEEHPQPPARERLAGGGDRRRDLGRVVGVVVDDRHAPDPRDLEAAAGAREATERRRSVRARRRRPARARPARRPRSGGCARPAARASRRTAARPAPRAAPPPPSGRTPPRARRASGTRCDGRGRRS